MSIQLLINNKNYPVKFIEFSDGATSIKVDNLEGVGDCSQISITVHPTTPCDRVMWELVSVLNALHFSGIEIRGGININLLYLPYGRADRVFELGNNFPLLQFLQSLSMLLECLRVKVNFYDPHNEGVISSLIAANCDYIINTQDRLFKEKMSTRHINYNSEIVLVAPDKGAKKKIEKLSTHFKNPTILYADKIRDITTGKIKSITMLDCEKAKGKNCLVVDDICDGGGTFLPIADQLRGAGASRVDLYVTHGIFSKGLGMFKGKYDTIYAWQTVGTYINATDILNFNEGKEVK